MFEQIRIEKEILGSGENLLLLGDGSAKLPALSAFEGQAQCVYLDPPFMTGGIFTRRRRYGTKGWRTGSPAPEFPAYDDRFDSRDAYLAFLRGMIENAHRLLKDTGVFCLHLDWRSAAYGRLLCDEVFGEDRFLNEIIWAYESGGRAKRYFSRKHDVILLYGRSRKYRFDLTRVPLPRTGTRRNHMKRQVDESGRAYRSIRSGGREYRYYDDTPTYPGDVWTDISHLQQRDPERTGYATQKPVKLLERLLLPVVNKGDLVVDLCCGSGTTLLAAQQLGCRYVGVDASSEALAIARNRLLPGNFTLHAPTSDDPVALDALYQEDGGVLTLTDFPARHPAFPKTERALDCLEGWAVGVIENGALRTLQDFHRTNRQPDLPLLCFTSGTPVISTVDAAGIRRAYRYVE